MADEQTPIKRSNSKDQVQFYSFNKQWATVYPDFSFQNVINMVNNDPIARGAINKFIDKCMEGDRKIINRQTLKYSRMKEDEFELKYKFRQEIERKLFLMLKLFNNAFIEIVSGVDEPAKFINVLDTMNIMAITETNGDPISYKSKVPNQKTGEYATWDKDKISWVKLGDRCLGYAPVDLRALWENLVIKDYIKRYTSWLWMTGQYRLIYNFKNAADQDIDDFLAFNRKHDNNFQMPFFTKGEMQTNLLRDMKEQESLVKMLEYLDNQTLVLLNVPPISVGIPDASGRSNSGQQGSEFDTTITSFKNLVEDSINYDLFPKIERTDILLKYAPNNMDGEKRVYEVLQIMQSLNFNPDAMVEYLNDKGVYFETEEELRDPLEIAAATNPRNLDQYPSRQGKGTGQANTQNDKPTTRKDQLK